MRTSLRLLVVAALAAPALALAQASAAVQLRLDLPVVMPKLVVVQPGVQVVPDVEEEIFFSDGWYWVRQDQGWYRSHSPRGGWFFVPPGRVPRRIVGLPPGQYRRWHAPPPAPRPAPARFAPQRAPAPDLHWRGGDDRGFDRGGDRGHGGRGKGHDKGRGRGHDRD